MSLRAVILGGEFWGRVGLTCAGVMLAWLQASCAAQPLAPALTPMLSYQPVLRSTLVADGDASFVAARHQEGAASTTLLALSAANSNPRAVPRAVARLVQVGAGSELHVSIEPMSLKNDPWLRSTARPLELELSTLEQLYALVFRMEPQARFCLAAGVRPCDTAQESVSHAQVLRALAAARSDLANRVPAPAAALWRVIDLAGGPTAAWDADLVGVRATAREVPVEGIAIHFNRAPHSMCVARTQHDGVASCRLQDQHGEGHVHDHAAAVVATFPGDVRPELVLLPTTFVLPRPAVLPRFATPVTPFAQSVLPSKP